MESKIVYLNPDIAIGCDICRSTTFRPVGNKIKKAHRLYDLDELEEISARRRLSFYTKDILICFGCFGSNTPKNYIWQGVLALPILADLDPSVEYGFELNELSYP